MLKIANFCLFGSLLLACSSSSSGNTAGTGGVFGAGGNGVPQGMGGTSNAGAPPVGAGGVGVVGSGSGGVMAGGGNAGSGAGPGNAGAGANAGGGVGMGGTGAGGGGGGAAGATAAACPGQNLPAVPDDTSARGPWVVGVKTIHIGRLTVEVTYPAAAGTEQGKEEATYDIREWLPKSPMQPSNYTPIADSESPAVKPIGGKLFRDLPLDTAHGPYPVIIFMHGTASFRIASGSLQTQWASRGFVVLAADYPGLMLADQLCSAGCGCTASGAADYPGDFKLQIDALKAGTGDVAFLMGHVDMDHVGFSGHSVGGCTVAASAGALNAMTIIPLNSTAPTAASTGLKSTMYISGMADTVFAYKTGLSLGNAVCPMAQNAVTDGFNASAGPPDIKKRLVGVTDGGHLTPTDLCQKNADGNNAITVLHNHHYCGVDAVAIVGLPTLFDCGANMFDWQVGVKDVAYASTAAFEETLTCRDRTAAFANIRTANPTIGDFIEMK